MKHAMDIRAHGMTARDFVNHYAGNPAQGLLELDLITAPKHWKSVCRTALETILRDAAVLAV